MPRLENASRYAKVDRETLLLKAKEVVELELSRSTIFEPDAKESLPHFDEEEIQTGKVVGRGGFCVVKELAAIKLKGPASTSRRISNGDSSRSSGWLRKGAFGGASNMSALDMSISSVEGARQHLARRVWSKKGGKYVVKQVEPELYHNDKVTFLKGIIDLALETHYLASLAHPHIMGLRGLSIVEPFEDTGYFLILDQLSEILSKRLNTWMHQKRATMGITGALTGGKQKVTKLLVERLLVAYDIAEALDYLHGRRIIYRDLKPDNVGFDSEGTVKIFDFGLAKELIEEEHIEDGLYRMTGFTGAIRYMAPEVGLKQPYGLKADVYSWSMLFWYIMALEPPMGLYTPKMFVERVFARGYRPATMDKWPPGVSSLMKLCWSEHQNERPDFDEVKELLKKEVTVLDPQVTSFLSESGKKKEKESS